MDNLKRMAPDFNGPSLSNQEDFERLCADWYGSLYHYAYSVLNRQRLIPFMSFAARGKKWLPMPPLV
jgi:hypothetical protein